MAVEIEPFYVSLGERIQSIRERKKLTQSQLGAFLDPPNTRASIANIEAGKQRVLAYTLLQIAKTLDVDLKELIPVEEQRPIDSGERKIIGELQQKLGIPKSAARQIAQQLKPSTERKSA